MNISTASLSTGVCLALYGGYKYLDAWHRGPTAAPFVTAAQQTTIDNQREKMAKQKKLAIILMVSGVSLMALSSLSFLYLSDPAPTETRICSAPPSYMKQILDDWQIELGGRCRQGELPYFSLFELKKPIRSLSSDLMGFLSGERMINAYNNEPLLEPLE